MSNQNEQFALIYDQYIGKIYRFVYLKVDSKEIAEDITSKVFLKGFEAYKKDPGIKNMGAFLYQIARNDVANHYRDSGKKQTISPDALPEAADDRTDLHQKAVFGEDVGNVKAALASLKKEHQDVLIWYYLEDMPAEEIAAMIGKPAGTVRVMIHRGLSALKDALNQEG